LAKELGKSANDIALLAAMNATNRISIPHAVAPGVPKERVQALRDAFEKTYKDPEVVKLADKAGMDLQPKRGEQVTVIVNELFETPQPVLETMKAIIEK